MKVNQRRPVPRLHVPDAKTGGLDIAFAEHCVGSEENADVFGRKHVLVEGQLAAGDLPGAVDAAKDILPPADVKVLFALRPAAVDDEVGVDLEVRPRLAGGDLDIGDHV